MVNDEDDIKRIKYSVTLTRLRSFWNAVAIHPAIGISMDKVPKCVNHQKVRPVIPPDIVKLEDMWSAALSRTVSIDKSCVLCESGEGDEIVVCLYACARGTVLAPARQ